MHTLATVSFVLALAPVAAASLADAPRAVGGMKHVMVTLNGSAVGVHVDDMPGDPASNPVELLRFPGESYTPGAALNDTYYSDRYGWLADGFISLGPDEHVWIEQLAATAGLSTYEGGMRMMRDMHSYDPIFSTDGSSPLWEWGGTMVHNWYAADAPGSYEATYRVFIGDSAGAALQGFTDAQVTLSFIAIPAPGPIALGALAMLGAARRRR